MAIDSCGQLECLWQVDVPAGWMPTILGDSLGDYRRRVTRHPYGDGQQQPALPHLLLFYTSATKVGAMSDCVSQAC